MRSWLKSSEESACLRLPFLSWELLPFPGDAVSSKIGTETQAPAGLQVRLTETNARGSKVPRRCLKLLLYTHLKATCPLFTCQGCKIWLRPVRIVDIFFDSLSRSVNESRWLNLMKSGDHRLFLAGKPLLLRLTVLKASVATSMVSFLWWDAALFHHEKKKAFPSASFFPPATSSKSLPILNSFQVEAG